MRFFSSDKNESNDQSNVDVQNRAEELNPDQAQDDQAQDDHPERVSSEPVAVPQQRTGSPWADAPGSPDDDSADAELADTERADGTDERPSFHEPGPQPTAFGASTVGGAVAASATANPQHDRWDVTDRDTDAASGVADDRSVAPGDGVVTDEASPWATGPDGEAVQRADDGDRPGESGEDRGDAALEDRGTFGDPEVHDEFADTGGPDPTPPDAPVETGTTTTYGPDGTVTTTDRTDRAESDADTDRVEGEPALRDEGGFDDPTAVDPATRQPIDADTREVRDTVDDRRTADDRGTLTDRDTVEDRDTGAEAAAAGAATGAVAGAAAGAMAADRPAGAPAGDTAQTGDIDARDTTAPTDGADTAVAAPATATTATAGDGGRTGEKLPGTVATPEPGSLFGESDAQTFRERWREVQLRFVDGPKDAAREAATLFDEAAEKLTANLRARKDSLMQDSDDTEQLRVQLRGYRDMINRILDL